MRLLHILTQNYLKYTKNSNILIDITIFSIIISSPKGEKPMNDYITIMKSILYLNEINKILKDHSISIEEKKTLIFQKVSLTNYLKNCFDVSDEEYKNSVFFLKKHMKNVKSILLDLKIDIDFSTNSDELYTSLVLIILDLMDTFTLEEEDNMIINNTFEAITCYDYDDIKVNLIYQSLEVLKFFDDDIYLENNPKSRFYYRV